MVSVVIIDRPDVVSLIEEVATKFTHGNKTEAVDLALRRFLERNARAGSLFLAHAGSVRVRDGFDLTAPALELDPDSGSCQEIAP
jgi:hypothetical protein